MDKLVGRSFNVNVTQNDIDKGECISSVECAIALAVNRDLGEGEFRVGYEGSSVGPTNISFANKFGDFSFQTNDDISKWVRAFDMPSQFVSPVSVKLTINSCENTFDLYGFRHVLTGDAEII